MTAHLSPETRQFLAAVLRAKIDVGKTSTKKWAAYQNAVCDDGVLRGMFQFGGAQRTMRWAGRLVQLHNLKRPSKAREKTITQDVELLHGGLDAVLAHDPDPLGLLSESVRCAITAPPGYLLLPCDYSSVESRVLAYLSQSARMLRIFAEGKDTYRDFATDYYGVAYDDVTGEQRFFCKPPVLGCGFMLSGRGLVAYAESMGVELSEKEGRRAVKLWRESYPEVPMMWEWLDENTKAVTQSGGVAEGYGVRIRRDPNFLFIDLPSGRSIYYYQPLVQWKVPPWELAKIDEHIAELVELGQISEAELPQYRADLKNNAPRRPTLTYMGFHQDIKKWMRLTTHPGKTTENIVQAFARDLIAYHMPIIEDLGPVIVGHVHDEPIALVPEEYGDYYLHALESLMAVPPPWAPGMLLAAEGFLTKRYTKN